MNRRDIFRALLAAPAALLGWKASKPANPYEEVVFADGSRGRYIWCDRGGNPFLRPLNLQQQAVEDALWGDKPYPAPTYRQIPTIRTWPDGSRTITQELPAP